MQIRPLAADDIDAAVRLSTEAGWNQHPADWQRLVAIWPRGCLALWVGNELVGTATVAMYGKSLGWIGMMLIDKAHRGAGLGGRMFSAICDRAEQLGVQRLALDATDLGRPVYRKQGFADHSGIRRWTCAAATVRVTPDVAIRPVTESDWPAVQTLDRAAMGVDRIDLLRHLAGEDGAAMCVAEQRGGVPPSPFKGEGRGEGETPRRAEPLRPTPSPSLSPTRGRGAGQPDGLAGFGLYRQGRLAGMVGPVVGRTPDAAEAVFTHLSSQRSGKPLICDLPDGSPLAPVLARCGWTVARTLTRMVRSASDEPLMAGPMVAAAAGFELG